MSAADLWRTLSFALIPAPPATWPVIASVTNADSNVGTVPSGVVADSLVVAYVYGLWDGRGTPIESDVTLPSGWNYGGFQGLTAGSIGVGQWWVYKRATGSESGTYTFTQNVPAGSSLGLNVTVMRITGAAASGSPFSEFMNGTDASPTVLSAFTADGEDYLALAGVAGVNVSDIAAPAGWTRENIWAYSTNRYALMRRVTDASEGSIGPTSIGSGGVAHDSFGVTIAPLSTVTTVDADTAVLSLSGQDVTASGAGSDATPIDADAAVLTLTGQTPDASAVGGPQTVTADTATLTLTGLTVTAGGTGTATPLAVDAALLTLTGVTPPTTAQSRWFSAVEQRATRTARILFIGDSWGEGEGDGTYADSLQPKLMSRLRSRYSVSSSGAGYLPPYYSSSNTAPATTTGTQNDAFGQGGHSVVLDAGEYVQWAGLTMTAFDVVYRRNSAGGDLNVTVDGGAAGSIDANGGSILNGRTQRFTTSAGTHTVRITAASGVGVVEGIVVYNGDTAGGFIQWDSTHSGWRSSDPGTAQFEGWQNFDPDLVVWQLYPNDALSDTTPTPAQAANNFEAHFNLMPTATWVFWSCPHFDFDDNFSDNGYTMGSYIDAIETRAVALGARVIDFRDYAVDFDDGYLSGDGVHPNATGYTYLADRMDEFLAATSGTVVGVAPRVTSTLTGTVNVAGTASASLPLITGSLSGTSFWAGTLSASLPVTTGSVTGTLTTAGTASASLPLIASAITGTVNVTSSLAGQLPIITGSVTGTVGGTGSLSAAVPLITGSVTGTVTHVASLTADLPKLTGSTTGAVTYSPTLSASLPLVTGAVTGTEQGDVTRTADGVLTLTGTAVQSTVHVLTANGTLAVTGTGVQVTQLARTASGVLTLTGAGDPSVHHVLSAAGTLSLTATADSDSAETPVRVRTADAVLDLLGTATQFIALSRTAAGDITLAGTATAATEVELTAPGELTVTGTADAVTRLTRTASAALVLSGLAEPDTRTIVAADGTLNLSGSASSLVAQVRAAIGTLNLTGDAAYNARIEVTAQGTMILVGSVEFSAGNIPPIPVNGLGLVLSIAPYGDRWATGGYELEIT